MSAEPAPVAANERRYLLYELTTKQCHHPIAEDRSVPGHFWFCGKPTVKRGWCAEHADNSVSFEDRKRRNAKGRANG